MKIRAWKWIILTLIIFGLPVIGLGAIFGLALCKAAGRASRAEEEMMRHADFQKGDIR